MFLLFKLHIEPPASSFQAPAPEGVWIPESNGVNFGAILTLGGLLGVSWGRLGGSWGHLDSKSQHDSLWRSLWGSFWGSFWGFLWVENRSHAAAELLFWEMGTLCFLDLQDNPEN